MAQATRPSKASKSRRPEESDKDAEDTPSVSDRASSGMRLAGHVEKAAEGGTLRKAFSLWRASKELPVAAAGATDLFKRHPIPVSVAAGALVTTGMLVLASRMGAFDSEGAEQSNGQDDAGSDGAEGEAEDGDA